MSSDVRGPHRNDSLFPTAYAVLREPIRVEPKVSLFSRLLRSRPFRKQYIDESWFEYSANKCAYYIRSYKRVLVLFAVLFVVCTLFFITRGTSEDIAKIELDVRPFGRETSAARSKINNSELLVVYAPTKCASLTKYTKRLQSSHALCVSCMRSNPLHDDNRDFAAFAVFAATLMEKNSREQMSCVCAPALGYQANMVAMRNGSVMRNAKLVGAPKLDRVVRHSQAAHFDIPDSFVPIRDSTSDVMIIRASTIDVQHETDDGFETVTLSDQDAFCMQECLDLMNGESIWDVALRQTNVANKGVNQYKC